MDASIREPTIYNRVSKMSVGVRIIEKSFQCTVNLVPNIPSYLPKL